MLFEVAVNKIHKKNYLMSLPHFKGKQVVNYLLGRPLIPYDFLKGIFTSNFRDMGNLRPSVFGLITLSLRVPKNGQLRFSERI